MDTKTKINLAKKAFSILSGLRKIFGLKDVVVVRRKGILWHLHLQEGIDFSIYLLGGFENETLEQYKKNICPGQTIFDVGANIGSHTLPFAKIVGPRGKVFAIEPTAFAFTKLNRNLNLNKSLIKTVIPIQAFLKNTPAGRVPRLAYSAWPLINSRNLHPVHRGRSEATCGAKVSTIDKICDEMNIKKVDFIKIDVDGNEAEVLSGALKTLKNSRPKIMLEWSPYLVKRKTKKIKKLLRTIYKLGYDVFLASNGKKAKINSDLNIQGVPYKGSVNLLLSVGT